MVLILKGIALEKPIFSGDFRKMTSLTEKQALSIYAKMLHTLDSSEFESFFSEDFSYSSQKVLTDMNSRDEFIEYIRPKL